MHLSGGHSVVPVYTEATPPTAAEALPAHERRRQVAASRIGLYTVLLADNRVVGASARAYVHPHDFCAQFSTTLQLALLQAPSSLSLQIWQRRFLGLADRLVAEVFVAVPDVASPPVPHWQHYAFSAHAPFAEADDAADDARALPLRYLSGAVDISVAWAAQPAQRPPSGRRANLLGGLARAARRPLGAADANSVEKHFVGACLQD